MQQIARAERRIITEPASNYIFSFERIPYAPSVQSKSSLYTRVCMGNVVSRVVSPGQGGGRHFLLSRGRAPRWEKGHRMALSPRSSVSEDVWTLIKMCRASGSAVSFFPPFSPRLLLPPPFHRPRSIPLPPHAAASCAAYACDRTQMESRLLKRPRSVTWTAAAGRRRRHLCGPTREVAIRRDPRMCRHFLPPSERPVDRSVGWLLGQSLRPSRRC